MAVLGERLGVGAVTALPPSLARGSPVTVWGSRIRVRRQEITDRLDTEMHRGAGRGRNTQLRG